jgi:hypothetical protein
MDWVLDWGVVVILVLVLALAWLLWQAWRAPKATTKGANPNPTNISEEMWWLWQQLQAMEPDSQLGGIYASKPGYHNCRQNLPSYDYSVCDQPPDGGGPANKACAIDWTFPEAHGGNYTRIAKYTGRLLASAKDLDDPRLDGWREFYGQADADSYVEGWDCRYGYAVTSDSSHLWHIHISENRDQSTSKANKEALLSVLRGEALADWLGAGGAEGDGAVLIPCPYDSKRQDLFYVSPDGTVVHRWANGINELWSGAGKSENLGGHIASGTLTAMWKADESGLYIAGLGSGDANGPTNTGLYWGMELNKTGERSGWGSFDKCYSPYPGEGSVLTVEAAETAPHWMLPVVVVAVALAVLALVVAFWA